MSFKISHSTLHRDFNEQRPPSYLLHTWMAVPAVRMLNLVMLPKEGPEIEYSRERGAKIRNTEFWWHSASLSVLNKVCTTYIPLSPCVREIRFLHAIDDLRS